MRTETVVGAFGKLCKIFVIIGLYQLDSSDQKNQERTANFVGTLPLQTDPEEAQYINRLFLKEVHRQNQNLFASEGLKTICKEAIVKMNSLASNNPELEILNDEGLQLLQKTIAMTN